MVSTGSRWRIRVRESTSSPHAATAPPASPVRPPESRGHRLRARREVSELASTLREHGVPVVPSGGRTGLAGGAVAACGELVLSLTRMRHLDPVDTIGATVRVEAGVVTEQVASSRGGARTSRGRSISHRKDRARSARNIATNAGGVKVIRYGLTRNWVLGLEVVLMGAGCSS